MSQLKLASTIMLGRDNGGNLEILLVKRNKALAFAGGLWVFPGGKIEAEDLAQTSDELGAAKLAGVRELKEETHLNLSPERLLFFRHWTTPVGEPRRFATYFFFGGFDEEAVEVQIDDSEIKEYCWLSPQEALYRLEEGEMGMMPPTIMSLHMVRTCQSVAEAEAWVSRQTPIFILPELKAEGDKMHCLFEGDAAYGEGNSSSPQARHRLSIDVKTGVNTFEFRECGDGVIPVSGELFP